MIIKNILIVDDSIVIRMILNKLLKADLDAEVSMAANGEMALEKANSQKPDLIILDIEMPRMNGIETLKSLHRLYPNIPIIMFSALTEADAAITLQALTLGASDFLSKHGEFAGGEIPLTYLRKELIPKISALLSSNFRRNVPEHQMDSLPYGNILTRTPNPTSSTNYTALTNTTHSVSILAIAVSTGGPMALEILLSQFPKKLKIPIVIVQHIPFEFTGHLVQSLARKCEIRILQCQEGLELEKGGAYIATGGRHMEVKKESGHFLLRMHDGPPENSCRPSGDILFRSVAQAYGSEALAVVLTGMGQDGLKGCEVLKAYGCPIIAQDEASSVIWGMPGAIVKAGLADSVLPLQAIPAKVMSYLS